MEIPTLVSRERRFTVTDGPTDALPDSPPAPAACLSGGRGVFGDLYRWSAVVRTDFPCKYSAPSRGAAPTAHCVPLSTDIWRVLNPTPLSTNFLGLPGSSVELRECMIRVDLYFICIFYFLQSLASFVFIEPHMLRKCDVFNVCRASTSTLTATFYGWLFFGLFC